MTTVPVRHGAVGVARPSRPSSLRRIVEAPARAEAAVKSFLQRWSMTMLRVALGGVFVLFGALKLVPGMSPVELLVQATWQRLTFGMIGGQPAMVLTAIMEVAAGGLLIIGGLWARAGLVVLAVAFVGILSPLVLLPGEVFGAAGPTLTGQYILKNAVLIAAALVVASRVLKGPDTRH